MRLKTSDVVCILSCDMQKGGMHGHEEIQAGPTRDARISPSDTGKAYHNLDAKERAKIAGEDCGGSRLRALNHGTSSGSFVAVSWRLRLGMLPWLDGRFSNEKYFHKPH